MNEVVFKPEPFKPVNQIPKEKRFSMIDYIVTTFLQSPYKTVCLDSSLCNNPYALASSIRRRAKDRGYSVHVVLRKGKVYLEKV